MFTVLPISKGLLGLFVIYCYVNKCRNWSQLYGCSNNQLDQNEIVLPVTELSESINQADEEKADVYSQTEENNAIRDNTVDTSQNISPEPEESDPITDNDYYRAATSISSAEVEQQYLI